MSWAIVWSPVPRNTDRGRDEDAGGIAETERQIPGRRRHCPRRQTSGGARHLAVRLSASSYASSLCRRSAELVLELTEGSRCVLADRVARDEREIETGHERARRAYAIRPRPAIERMDAEGPVLEDPHFGHAEAGIHIELVDEWARMNDLDHDLGDVRELLADEIALVGLGPSFLCFLP